MVSTNGAQEVLQNGVTGVLCEISGQSVADKVRELLNNADVLENLRENVSKSDMDADNKQVLALLDELL